MLPEALLTCSVRDGRLVPHFLGAADHPWLRVLLDEHARFVGRPRRELDDRLSGLLPCESPDAKRKLAVHVLGRLSNQRVSSPVPPPRARSALFRAATRAESRPIAVATAAGELGCTSSELEQSLFADLPGERLVVESQPAVSPGELALRANLALVQGLLYRSSIVRVKLEGNARTVVRHALFRGLLCVVSASGAEAGEQGAVLEISGPFSLFRKTVVYGRRLAELVPLLSWCSRYRLEATCHLRGRVFTLGLASGDPILPAGEPRRYDSALEERFARDFGRLALDWEALREPAPVNAGATLVFPDFALRHRQDPSRRWLVELVGFWTPGYLQRKLALYREARLPNLILCIDESQNCAADLLPEEARVLRFRRRVDAAAVLRLIGG